MKIDSLPRYRLATLPTPLDEAPRLSQQLGIRVLIKRDDLTGFALGGNKVRKLEFLLADAIDKGADTLVTGGGPQSNHARTTAAAARLAGMNAVLVLSGKRPDETNGNLLLDELLGAEIRFAGDEEGNAAIQRVAAELAAQGRKPYAIPIGGSNALGAISYLVAAGELLEQCAALGIQPDGIFITSGSCGTHAGVLAGIKYYGWQVPVNGISIDHPAAECVKRISRLVADAAAKLDTLLPLAPDDIDVNDRYIGPGYAVITPETREAIRLVARCEGIFLDPVYTGKTMAGLIDQARTGQVSPGSTIVFWHTGGVPGLFGQAKEVIELRG